MTHTEVGNARRFAGVSVFLLALLSLAHPVRAIVGFDYEDTGSPPDYRSVVSLAGAGSCTATLISPSHVLTAGHCVHEGRPTIVRFVARELDAAPELTLRVHRCWVHPFFNERTAGRRNQWVRPEFRDQPLGDRCGRIMRDVGTLDGGDTAVDFAVLQLARPVPHPIANPDLAGAGAVVMEPIPVVTMPPAVGDPFDGVAVGFGATVSGGSDGGTRRVKAISRTMSATSMDGAPLARGDSGGPLLIDHGGGALSVLGVASTEDEWALLDRPGIRDWIASKVDTNGDGRADIACTGRPHGSDPLADASSDPDGDGHLTGIDSCPDTYNPCQGPTDSDGDGTPDDCDACPGDSGIAVLRASTSLSHSDDDGIPDVCDCNPDAWDPVLDDRDGDFIAVACDNCRETANALQVNTDGDSRGDACDPCPEIFDNVNDSDGDGFPNECDNCPAAGNATQSNCNLDVETALWFEACPPLGGADPSCPSADFLAGDACDETPCGETRVDSEFLRLRDESVENAVRVDALAGYAFLGRPEDAPPPTEIPARSGFRFCRCSAATRDDPDVRTLCLMEEIADGKPPSVIGGCDPLDLDAYDATEEPANWRWTTMAVATDPAFPNGDHGTAVLAGEEDLVHATPRDGIFETDLWAEWQLANEDMPRWETDFGETFPSAPFARLPGVLWTHTPGPWGGGDATDWDRTLASHLWSGRARIPTKPVLPNVPPSPCFDSIGPLLGEGGFGTLPMPWLGRFSNDCLGPPDLAAVRVGEDVFGPQPAFDPEWLQFFAAPGVRWVSAAEPGPWLPVLKIRYAALDAAKLSLLGRLAEGEDGLEPIEGADPCNNCNSIPVNSVKAAGGAAVLANGAEAPARESLLVLSARRGLLWAIEPKAEGVGPRIRVMVLEDGVWGEPVESGAVLGTVLAATYSPTDDALWVVDEVPRRRQGRRAHLRLLRIEASSASAHARLVALARGRTGTTSIALAAGPEGALYLARGDTRPSGKCKAAVARLSVDSEGLLHREGAVVAPGCFASDGLRADERGLTLVIDDPAHGDLPIGIEFGRFQKRCKKAACRRAERWKPWKAGLSEPF